MPDDPRRSAGSRLRPTRTGVGRLLIAVYGLFALSAGARAAVQIATHFDQAPLAYTLSAVAAAVYLLATIGLAGSGPRFRMLAWLACGFELLGVLVVGTVSLAVPAAFPADTVWSGFGRGYGFVPLVLPVLGLAWLRYTGRHPVEERVGPEGGPPCG